MTIVTPRAPSPEWLARFLEPSLIKAAPYKIDTPPAVTVKLDQNESPYDWPRAIKETIVRRVVDRPWNRYPSAFADDLAAKVAAYAGVSADSVLLGPGSNYLCSLILSVFSKGIVKQRGGRLVIARPSFPLYESHCNYEGIPYQAWELDKDLEYDLATLPALEPGSMVVFASPNNPVGNVLKREAFEGLLKKHPDVLFVADEAYFEYTKEVYTELLGRYSNFFSVRTFSKTLGYAGVRIGYVVAAPQYLTYLKKLRLPFLLNHFSLAAAEVILEDPQTKTYIEQTKRNAIGERERVYAALREFAPRGGFHVKSSEANFLLLRWSDQERTMAFYRGLIAAGILVRDVSPGPGLKGCLRVTIGEVPENTQLIEAFKRLCP